VTLTDATAVDTTATFSAVGVYVLELSANDGAVTSTARITITAGDASGATRVTSSVIAGSDDAEESSSGTVAYTSADLELVRDSTNQVVGVRFRTVDVPPGATIVNAYVQFQADTATSEATTLVLQGELTPSALTFTSGSRNLSSRVRTTASVSWSPPPWTTAGQAGVAQQTPNLAPVVQELVNQPGWTRGNPLVVLISGTGRRTAESFEGGTGRAPRLVVDYTMSTVGAATMQVTEESPVVDDPPFSGLEGITEPPAAEDALAEKLPLNHTLYLPLIQQ
jgi:hypothetical protein